MKKASEWSPGCEFFEKDGESTGKVISMADDPCRPTMTYLLVLTHTGFFSIYGCLRDAKCEPFLTRHIPPSVIRTFLFDAFVGMELSYKPQEGPVRRCPVMDVPNYPDPQRQSRPAPGEPAKPRMVGDELQTHMAQLPDPPVRRDEPPDISVAPEPPETAPDPEPAPQPVRAAFLPEMDFP